MYKCDEVDVETECYLILVENTTNGRDNIEIRKK